MINVQLASFISTILSVKLSLMAQKITVEIQGLTAWAMDIDGSAILYTSEGSPTSMAKSVLL